MQATEFVKKFGWDRAKREVDLIGTIAAMCCEDDFNNDLKCLIESWELVEENGGLKEAKEFLRYAPVMHPEVWKLKDAIKDVESCKA